MGDIKDQTVQAVTDEITTFASERRLNLGDMSVSTLAEALTETLLPLAARSDDYDSLFDAATETVARLAAEFGIDLPGSSVVHRVVEAVRETVRPVLTPYSLRLMASLLEESFPEDHDSYVTAQNLYRFATTLETED